MILARTKGSLTTEIPRNGVEIEEPPAFTSCLRTPWQTVDDPIEMDDRQMDWFRKNRNGSYVGAVAIIA
jgi:hypothetical protein